MPTVSRSGPQADVFYPGGGPEGRVLRANDGYAPDAGASRTIAFEPRYDLTVTRLVMCMTVVAGGDDQIEMAIWDAARDTKLFTTGTVTGITTTLTLAPKAVTSPGTLPGGRRYIAEIYHITTNATTGSVACVRTHPTVGTSQQALLAGATLLTQEFGKANPGAHTSIASMAGTTTSIIPLIGILKA